jgi:hypothetical protein
MQAEILLRLLGSVGPDNQKSTQQQNNEKRRGSLVHQKPKGYKSLSSSSFFVKKEPKKLLHATRGLPGR